MNLATFDNKEARAIILNQRRLEVEIAEIAVALYRLKIGR